MNNYWLNKLVSISNNFEKLQEVFDDKNDNAIVEKTIKPPPIFVRVNNIQPLSQMLEEIIIGEYEIKIINNE